MRHPHIAKRSVLGNSGVKFYVKNCEANLSIGPDRLGEALLAIFPNPLPLAVRLFA